MNLKKRPPKLNEKVKVLIVEDIEDAAKTVTDLLGRLGFETGWVSDGDKAYGQMKILKPDIVVLDLNLPGKTGDLIAEQMLKDPDFFIPGDAGRGPLIIVPAIPYSVHLKESADPESLGNKFTKVHLRYTGAAPEMGVAKGSLKDLVVEITVACGEIFGGIPRALLEYWKRSDPYKMPPYGVLPENV